MDTKKCAHPRCSCTVDKEHKYCSQACEDSHATNTIGCDCPHTSCNGKL